MLGRLHTWPIDGTQNVDLFLRATRRRDRAGTLGATAGGGAADTLGFTASTGTSEGNLMGTPTGAQTNRRVFLSRPLTTDLRLSGTAAADIAASLGATQSNLSVVVAEYGVTTQVSTERRGHHQPARRAPAGACRPTASPATRRGRTDRRRLHGVGAQGRHACYLERQQAVDDDERHARLPRHARHP